MSDLRGWLDSVADSASGGDVTIIAVAAALIVAIVAIMVFLLRRQSKLKDESPLDTFAEQQSVPIVGNAGKSSQNSDTVPKEASEEESGSDAEEIKFTNAEPETSKQEPEPVKQEPEPAKEEPAAQFVFEPADNTDSVPGESVQHQDVRAKDDVRYESQHNPADQSGGSQYGWNSQSFGYGNQGQSGSFRSDAQTQSSAPSESQMSVLSIGDYVLFDTNIQVSSRKSVKYEDMTAVRYERDYRERVIVVIDHAWELTLSAGPQTRELYDAILTRMNADIIREGVRKKKMRLESGPRERLRGI